MMSIRKIAILTLVPFLWLLGACHSPSPSPFTHVSASTPSGSASTAPQYYSDRGPNWSEWAPGQAIYQGYLGVTSLENLVVSDGTGNEVDGSTGSINQYPVIGGGAQVKLAGKGVAMGLEAFLSLGGRANGGAFIVGGGGGAIAVSLDMLIVDIHGGPFISIPLGERVRVYGSLGPAIQFANYYQASTDVTDSESGTGFGVGVYSRAGVEVETSPGSYVGVGLRWFDTSIDLGGGLGDLDVEGIDAMLTFSVLQ